MQAPSRKEYEEAHAHAFDITGPDPFKQAAAGIREHGYPKVLVVGASHGTHWASFAISPNTSEDDAKKLETVKFASVGGATLDNIISWVQGINLPAKKRKLRNQWREIYETGFNLDFILFTIGSNTVDEIDRYAKKQLRCSVYYSKTLADIKKECANKLVKQQANQVKLVKFARRHYPAAKLAYLNITPRVWWGPHARHFASHLDYSFSRKIKPAMKNLRVPNLYINKHKNKGEQRGYMDHIMNGLLDFDKIHLNDWGYHILTHDIMSSLSISLYNPPYGPGSKKSDANNDRSVSLL